MAPSVRPEEHILQCVRGAVGCRDEAKKKEDEVGHTEQLSELFVDDLLPERHLLLRVSPESIPTDDILHNQRYVCLKNNWISFRCLKYRTE